VNHKAQD